MGEVPKIADLNKVIEPHLPEGSKLVSYESSYLTKPGEHYGSLMLAIKAQIKKSDNTTEELPIIAKLPPLTNDLYWQIFQPERTCITENAVYKYLSAELNKLQLEAGILPTKLFDGLPRYYGSRISLQEDAKKVDRDAVLLAENLTVRGYKPGNRHKPYDLAHTILILNNLAQYHALPIALRLKKPHIYDKFVRPYFRKFDMNTNIPEKERRIMDVETLADIKALSDDNEGDVKRVEELLQIYSEFQAGKDVEDGPFTTLVHGDLWINNLMIKYNDEGIPSKLKFVDFQICQYESLIHDIIFLLFSSVENEVLEANYYKFLKIYYKAFIKCLNSVEVDTSNYSFDAFQAEVQKKAHIQVPHAVFMMKVVMADSSTIPDDYKDVDLTVISKNRGSKKIMDKLSEILRLAKKFNIF
ncbi:LOW QUALITY PROTEIN: uncharacterized protein [Drosophila tropicalis]|uniref:LOW QUALITY PROTEIN: uncharacterized protein n=1 Tax=Drosophila tropicalis TaxID=46794 RepID=UPI0035AB8DD7